MLVVDRIKSNKLIRNLKVVAFAGALATITPINVYANENVAIETTNTSDNEIGTIGKIGIGAFIFIVIVNFNVYNELKREDKDNVKIKEKKKDSE